MSPIRSWLRVAALGSLALSAGVVGVFTALSCVFARRVLTPSAPEEGVIVWSIEPLPSSSGRSKRVWIHGPDAGLPGKYSFIFNDGAGHARLGPVVDRVFDGGVDRVARDVIAIDRGELRVGARGRITGWWYTDPRELSGGVELVTFPVDGGESWGWLVHPENPVPGRFAVHVHGRGARPEETLRGLAPVTRAGVTSLVIAYRNDPGAPVGIRGRYGLGLAERYDVDSSIAWLLRQGADRITLVGWSMGGITALLSATRGPHRALIDGLVLDSPGLDWGIILRRQARLAGLPEFTARVGMKLMRQGIVRGAVPWQRGTDFDSMSPDSLAPLLRAPVLMHVSPGDSFVPWRGSLRLKQLRPDLVRIREGSGEHVKLWNVDPLRWESETEEFVRNLGAPMTG
ncbi:alpha/beta hydrolase family protein [Leucobacter sp. W1153]|uniref:alpha/beta hydrolase family protein n=1 Tax=unclassified Leucobacter TaxID=2621730 RepID=UPI003F2C0B84